MLWSAFFLCLEETTFERANHRRHQPEGRLQQDQRLRQPGHWAGPGGQGSRRLPRLYEGGAEN